MECKKVVLVQKMKYMINSTVKQILMENAKKYNLFQVFNYSDGKQKSYVLKN